MSSRETFLSPEQARVQYDLQINPYAETNPFDQALSNSGIAMVDIPLTDADFATLTEKFADCIDYCPDELQQTAGQLDRRRSNEVGYTRKDLIIAPTKVQLADAKHVFHFTDITSRRWQDEFRHSSRTLRAYLDQGREIQHVLMNQARTQMSQLEDSHPNISKLYFPEGPGNEGLSFLRVNLYDRYLASVALGDVAKAHYDKGGLTYQAYADAPGFWGATEQYGPRTLYDTQSGKAYVFAGQEHRKIYGSNDAVKALWHGVERINPPEMAEVPERSSVILFVDAPMVDYKSNREETLGKLVIASEADVA